MVRVRVIRAADKKDCLQLTRGAVTEGCGSNACFISFGGLL
jgi:hypothetical protein